MPYSVFFALILVAILGCIRIYRFVTRTKSILSRSGVRPVSTSRARKNRTSTTADSKSNQWYRNLYLQLHNLEGHADVLEPARDELLAMFSHAITIGLEQPQGGILSIKKYDSKAVWKLIGNEHKIVMAKWQAYLDKRKQGHGPELFGTIEAAKNWLVQRAPVKFVDGAWLGHINKITTPFSLRSFTKDAWQIFSEELGDGDLSKHHVYLYRQLLQDIGCYLPEGHHADFTKPGSWDGLENRHAWEGAVGQLLISLFPNEFLPEILGFNMHYELVTIETMQAAFELKALGINPYYFLLHIAIDNADSGHTAMAAHIVTRYLDRMRATDGEAAVAQAWKRVQVGYILSQTLGNPVHDERQSPSVAVADVPLDPLSIRVSDIFKAKAAVSQQIHCQSRVRLGGRTLTEWLDQRTWTQAGKNQQLELLTALSLAKPWVYPGASAKSHLLRELSWKGRMYGAFTHEETAAFAAWIDSLGPNNSAWIYWRFTGRKPLTSNDAVAKLQDPARYYPSMLPPDDAEETVTDLVPIEFNERGHQAELRIEKPPPLMLSKERLPDLVALWFAHIGLLENTLNTPSRTTTPLYASLLRLRRAEAGFGLETDIVAGTDEMNRMSCPGLVEVGLDLISRSGWATNVEFSCIRDILDLASSHGQNNETMRLVNNMLRWSLRPVKNLGLLLGLSLAFMELKKAIIDLPELLSLESRVVLEAIVMRERQHLEECVQELRRIDQTQYRHLVGGYKFGRVALEICFVKVTDK
jgi:hypothetical protein